MLRAERVVENQVFQRSVNEFIGEAAARFDKAGEKPPATYAFRCECTAAGCTAHVLMTTAEYEQLRLDPTRFVVALGHEVASA